MNYLEIGKFPENDYACSEALNMIATNLFFCGDDIKSIILTSRYADEGKSFIAMNLMRTLANLNKRVLLVDADLRRSHLAWRYHFRFPDSSSPGLAHYLAGQCDVEDVVYETNLPNAYLLPVGREVRNSLRLLSSSRLPVLLEILEANFDLVLIDAPPAGVIADPLEIAKHCSGSIMVVSAECGQKQDITDVANALRKTGCPILGAVFNKVKFDSYTNRKYYYRSKRYSSYYNGEYNVDVPDPETNQESQ